MFVEQGPATVNNIGTMALLVRVILFLGVATDLVLMPWKLASAPPGLGLNDGLEFVDLLLASFAEAARLLPYRLAPALFLVPSRRSGAFDQIMLDIVFNLIGQGPWRWLLSLLLLVSLIEGEVIIV